MKRGACAHLTEDTPLRAIWPNGMVPIQNFLEPRACELQGYGTLQSDGIQQCWLVDVKRLTPEELERAVAFMAKASGAQPAQIKADIERHGHFPLRAKHVASTSNDLPFFI